MDSLLKCGDKVLVKKQYDKGATNTSYPHVFTVGMLRKFGGKIVTIARVYPENPGCLYICSKYPLYVEPYYYCIEEDGLEFMWSFSMFELASTLFDSSKPTIW